MDYAHILKHARITEKATMHQAGHVYTFDVASYATKRDIVRAVLALYKVKPIKVATVMVPEKKVRNMKTGKIGVKKGSKKAYVFIKQGETINIS
ncbi:MAG TPA: 50S ribosomal protein L23 [Candidatus Paceibacterota bacterium]